MLKTFNMSIHELSKEAPARFTITILFLAANPTDTTRLKLGEESQAIDQALQQTEFREKFHLEPYNAVRVENLQSYLLRYKPDIVHFSGHGSSAGEIILQTGTADCEEIGYDDQDTGISHSGTAFLYSKQQPVTGRTISSWFHCYVLWCQAT